MGCNYLDNHGVKLNFNATDVDKLQTTFLKELYNMYSARIHFEGLPETIPEDELKRILFFHGSALFYKSGGKLYVWFANRGGELNAYYKPTEAVLSNSVTESQNLKLDEVGVSDPEAVKVYLTDIDEVFEDSSYLLDVAEMYACILADNICSINCAQINSRVQRVFEASDSGTDSDIEGQELALKRLYSGKPYTIMRKTLIQKTNMFSDTVRPDILSTLIEGHQYVKSLWLQTLGVDSNYNMKRERLISAELETNTPVLDVSKNIIKVSVERGLEKVNDIFNTEITFRFVEPEAEPEEINNEEGGEASIETMGKSEEVDGSDEL